MAAGLRQRTCRGQADGQGDGHVCAPVHPDRGGADALVNALREFHGVRALGTRQEYGELITTKSRAGIAGTDLRLGTPRHFLERLVTRQVPEAVIDLLEIV